MNKKVILLAVAATVFHLGNSFAATKHLSEFDWDTSLPGANRAGTSYQTTSEDGESSNFCMKHCPGYSMTVTECSNGYELVSCNSANCSQYHKCEYNGCAPGYDTALKDCSIEVQEDNFLCSKCIE